MTHDPSSYISEFNRFRLDVDGLNSEAGGWLATENSNVTLDTGKIYRWRVKARETAAGTDNLTCKLQWNRNSVGWVDADAYDVSTPGIICVLSSQYANADAITTEFLSNTVANINGAGIEGTETTGSFSPVSQEFELEFAFIVPSFYDGYNQNVDGNTIELRIIESDGTLFVGTYSIPTITVNETTNFIGGVVVETPSNIGVFTDSNGNMYYIMEHAFTGANIDAFMIKSTDGGVSWAEVDGAGRPSSSSDLEGTDVFVKGDTLHIMIQKDGDSFWYNTFHMSSHSTTPDEWVITDEVPDAGAAVSPIQVTGITVLSDDSLWGFWKGDVGGNDAIFYKKRTSGGTWDVTETNVDTTASTAFSGFQVVLGESDLTHIFYFDDTNGDIYYKNLTSGGTLSGRTLVEGDGGAATRSPMTQAVYWDDAGEENILIVVMDDSDGLLYSVNVLDGTVQSRKAASDNIGIIDNAGELGSDQLTANLAIDPATKTAYLHYAHGTTEDLYRTEMVNDAGWNPDVEEKDAVTAQAIRGRVFTHSSGAKVLGYVWTDKLGDNLGGLGLNQWYAEYVIALAPQGTIAPFAQLIRQMSDANIRR